MDDHACPIEYAEVERVSVDMLDKYGAEGWRPAALRWEERVESAYVPCMPAGWSGLLYREVPHG